MKKKRDEIKADKRLKQLGVSPKIFHFEGVGTFTAISIVDDRLTWAGARRAVDDAVLYLEQVPTFVPATQFINRLHRHDDIYGLAVCDRHNLFDRRLGRTIAKGRLWKHLMSVKILPGEATTHTNLPCCCYVPSQCHPSSWCFPDRNNIETEEVQK